MVVLDDTAAPEMETTAVKADLSCGGSGLDDDDNDDNDDGLGGAGCCARFSERGPFIMSDNKVNVF